LINHKNTSLHVTIHYSSREKKYCQTNKNNRYKKFLLNKNILKKRKNKKNEEKKI